MINDIKIYAKAMKWGKWPFLASMILAAIIVLIIGPESSSRIGTLFGYYFQIIFAFTLLSGGIFIFYSSLVLERVASNYSDKLVPILPFFSPVHAWRFFRFAMAIGDEKLHRLAKMGIFWLYCTCSIFVTVPIGIAFLALV